MTAPGSPGRLRRVTLASLALACLCVLAMLTACSRDEDEPVTLRVLASSELADMQPLFDDLRRDTGITLTMEYQGTVEATASLVTGDYRHDLAWLSSSRPFQLKLKEGGRQADGPLSTSIMRSPVVVGLKPEVAERLRRAAPDGQLSWADLADAAAAGTLKYAMADPRSSNSGLAALVGVATAAAGTGGALRPEDVSCDRLRGFFAGHALTDDSSGRLTDAYARGEDGLDGLITYESELLTLNRAGTLRVPLEIVYPKDGIVLSDYPLMLLDPAKRAAYDRLAAWLRSEPVQRKIMERTLRRPVDPGLTRVPSLRTPLGNALYFPDSQAVLDRLLADYADARGGRPARVIFLLDYSGSMRGERIANLRATMDGLSGADGSPSGKFARFHQGETLTVVRFGGGVLDEQSVTYKGAPDLERLRGMLPDDGFDASTAVWSALDHGYRTAAAAVAKDSGQRVSIVLMTDGENNAGMSLDAFLARYAALSPAARAVRTYTVRYGEADPRELDRAARATGGHMADATGQSLLNAFKEIRGCHE
ncbi:VWA domain-containing protein [Streptomyces sp. NBC_00047]|uniref:VWA domain-containing protein n=1 Tax=Streptomyces sp. NBC_00047 TaxID=2975627 RepID=UPI002254A595|nr:VWA domain-containing protein [Streptomyces sp. NBC_00047]MCX5609356.1 VWA domain-containing protein [Streptomyces sp. NBC_00047]